MSRKRERGMALSLSREGDCRPKKRSVDQKWFPTLTRRTKKKERERARRSSAPAARASFFLSSNRHSMAGQGDDAMLEDEAPPPGVERAAGGEAPNNASGGGIDRPPIAAASLPLPLAGPSSALQSSAAPMSLDLPESSAAAVAKQAQALADAAARQRASSVAVPADDGAVRLLLRSLTEPITLFGEREYERRDRARKLLARMDPLHAAEAVSAVTEGGGLGLGAGAGAALGGPSPFFVPLRPEEAQTELFYTEGSEELERARREIAVGSLEAAARRLERERRDWEVRRRRRESSAAAKAQREAAAAAAAEGEGAGTTKQADNGTGVENEEEEEDPDLASDLVASSARSPSSLRLLCSELGDGRPLSTLAFNSDSSFAASPSSSSSASTVELAVGSWSGCASLWRADAASGSLLASASSLSKGKGGGENDNGGNASSAASASSRSWWRAHDDRVTGIAWRPFHGNSDVSNGTRTAAPIVVDLATASADGTARLWSSRACALAAASAPSGAPCAPKPLAELKGHAARLARLAWHPGFGGECGASGGSRYLATASFDGSWRLWDAERATFTVSSAPLSPDSSVSPSCLLEQEGHSRAVYCLAWHPDGALLISAGLDAHARVSDVRTGKTVCVLSGHAKGILAVDVDPRDGATVATGAEDGTVKLWDLRARGRAMATLPAHSSLVSTCRFLRRSSNSSSSPSAGSIEGRLLLTAGYDGEAKVWDSADGRLLRTLRGHESRVMSSDIVALPSPSSKSKASFSSKASSVPALLVATSAYDRTLKLWGRLD